jgi:hypothetical protein
MWPVNSDYNELLGVGLNLEFFLRAPEIAALIARAPDRFGPVLRPLLSMLWIKVPAELRLPQRAQGPEDLATDQAG